MDPKTSCLPKERRDFLEQLDPNEIFPISTKSRKKYGLTTEDYLYIDDFLSRNEPPVTKEEFLILYRNFHNCQNNSS